MMKSVSLMKLIQPWQISRGVLLVLLLVLVIIGAVPGYLTGNWPWAKLPPVTNLQQIKVIRKTGIELSDWQTVEQQTIRIGGHKWSLQFIEQDQQKPVWLFLLPQNGPKSQPQVEWEDISGFMRQRLGQWKTDSYSQIKFVVNGSDVEGNTQADPTITTQPKSHPKSVVNARFFRAWNQRQTFAIVQWYAWPEGGNPAPSRWFWADQLAQLHRKRVPWVAVNIQIPIEPLGDLENYRPIAESLSKMLQTALMSDPFAEQASSIKRYKDQGSKMKAQG
ncbi:cyanoexosortase B system-associated protein [Moorena sp. SIO4G3]|nr:cyanoexosortase B system-associated protein [Moorena sp. SIO4G3]